jgi:hypothetical protein
MSPDTFSVILDMVEVDGYFGVMVPPFSVKWCHFERYCNYS